MCLDWVSGLVCSPAYWCLGRPGAHHTFRHLMRSPRYMTVKILTAKFNPKHICTHNFSSSNVFWDLQSEQRPPSLRLTDVTVP